MEREKVVILCGGKGTRMREETEFRPKPLVTVGRFPILWHIMKIYSHYGYNDFVLCLGYKGDMIKQYFKDYFQHTQDFTMNLKNGQRVYHGGHNTPDWNITFANTGANANTGARVKKVERYINTDNFMVTYGDGVGNVNISEVMRFHKQHMKKATVTSVLPPPRWSSLKLSNTNEVLGFDKNVKLANMWIDGGFFAFRKDVFDYLSEHPDCMLEREPMHQLSREGNLLSYQHHGYWRCMDTVRDMSHLNEIWSKGNAPWKVWYD